VGVADDAGDDLMALVNRLMTTCSILNASPVISPISLSTSTTTTFPDLRANPATLSTARCSNGSMEKEARS
jgi:hypothetical protein